MNSLKSSWPKTSGGDLPSANARSGTSPGPPLDISNQPRTPEETLEGFSSLVPKLAGSRSGWETKRRAGVLRGLTSAELELRFIVDKPRKGWRSQSWAAHVYLGTVKSKGARACGWSAGLTLGRAEIETQKE